MNPPDIAQDDLIAALQAERPDPAPEFAASLDARVAESFRRDDLWTRLRRAGELLPAGRRAIAPAMGGIAVGVVALGIAISQPDLGGGGPGSSPPRPLPATLPATGGSADPALEDAKVAGMTAQTTAEGAGGSVPPSLVDPVSPPPIGQPALPNRRSRAVERSAQVVLATEPGGIEEVADGVIRIVDRYRGVVASSSVTGGDAVGAGAHFQLLIPGSRLRVALADLSRLAHVRTRTEGSFDVTGPVVSARKQLREAMKRGVEAEIAAAKAHLRSLEGRVRFARVDVSIVADEAAAGPWGIDDAVDDAGRVLAVLAGAALVGLAALVPLSLLVAVSWLVYAALRRRRRERALE